MKNSWSSHEQVLNKSWTICEKVMIIDEKKSYLSFFSSPEGKRKILFWLKVMTAQLLTFLMFVLKVDFKSVAGYV